MVHQSLFFALIWLVAFPLFAQDERYYRSILSGDLQRSTTRTSEPTVSQFNVKGDRYLYDLNGDGIEETLEPQKRDGVDWLEIRNSSGGKVFEVKLLANGPGSVLYKIKLVQISPTVRAAILFFDEGFTRAKRFEATAKIYVLSFENNDLRTLAVTEGPHFFHEKEAQREQYWRRDYSVNVYDMDGDGVREISVMYNHIQRILKYRSGGEWSRL